MFSESDVLGSLPYLFTLKTHVILLNILSVIHHVHYFETKYKPIVRSCQTCGNLTKTECTSNVFYFCCAKTFPFSKLREIQTMRRIS